jgi:hypothetical protein
MLINAHLKGHEFDLLTLAELFHEGDPAVAGDHEGYCLSFTVPDELYDNGSRLYDAASVLLRRVNGVTRTLNSDFRPVALTGRFSDEDGRQHQVVLVDTAEARERANPITVSGGAAQPPPPPAPGPGYVQLAQTHPDIVEVLDIFGAADPAPNWAELYKIHEILLDNVPEFYQRGWVTRDQISAFTASANRKEVSGELARHARLKGDPPKRTMTLVEARQADRFSGHYVAGLAGFSLKPLTFRPKLCGVDAQEATSVRVSSSLPLCRAAFLQVAVDRQG